MTATSSETVSNAVVRGMRWWIAGLLFLVTLINLVDRSTIGVLAPVITAQLRLSNLQFASINIWFQVPYALSQALSGKLFDRIGAMRLPAALPASVPCAFF